MKAYYYQERISFSPFRKFFKKYSINTFFSDARSALCIAFMALPQSMAYALIAGLPLSSGFYAAIFGTIFSGAFGASRHLISGPSNATALLIQVGTSQILYFYYRDVPQNLIPIVTLHIVTQLVLTIGVLQFIASLLKFGSLTQFISKSVMIGYITGVAFAVIIGQVPSFLGMEHHVVIGTCLNKLIYILTHINEAKFFTTLLGAGSLVVLIFLNRILPKTPNALLMLVLAASVIYFINPFEVVLLREKIASISMKVPFIAPYCDFDIFSKVLPVAFAISILTLFEINSVTRLIATKTDRRFKINQDLFGVSISNLICSFIPGAMTNSASPSRSILNVNMGGKTRFAAILSGLFLFLIFFFLKPLISYIPITALAAMLFVIAVSMIDLKMLRVCLNTTREDAIVLIVTTLSCILFNLDTAFYIGIILSIALYLKQSAHPKFFEQELSRGQFKKVVNSKSKEIRVINIDGNLFFGSCDSICNQLFSLLQTDTKVFILRFTNTKYMDASTCFSLHFFLSSKRAKQKKFIFSDVNHKLNNAFKYSGLTKLIGDKHIFLKSENDPNSATIEALKFGKTLL